jgi:uncharacterized membrane protein YsdA (DUF1294 family)
MEVNVTHVQVIFQHLLAMTEKNHEVISELLCGDDFVTLLFYTTSEQNNVRFSLAQNSFHHEIKKPSRSMLQPHTLLIKVWRFSLAQNSFHHEIKKPSAQNSFHHEIKKPSRSMLQPHTLLIKVLIKDLYIYDTTIPNFICLATIYRSNNKSDESCS